MMFEPGQLRSSARAATKRALEAGALVTLETRSEIIEDGGIPFVVRILSSRQRKEQDAVFQVHSQSRPTNPFLPYDPCLFVSDLSPTHICLLNKYNVVSRHLLMVTRDFELQDAPLSLADFQSIAMCLREFDGLAFYNSDKTAGASQPHKHLQFVPMDAEPVFRELPIEPVLREISRTGKVAVSGVLPFRHSFICFQGTELDRLSSTPEDLLLHYQELNSSMRGQHGSHNLLVTRRWMMLVPRSRESFRSISVNALGYSGSLLVKNSQELEWIRATGPMELLRSCAFESS